MNKFQAAQQIRSILEKRMSQYEHVEGFSDMIREFENLLLGNESIIELLHFQEYGNGNFYLGSIQAGKREGLGVDYYNNGNIYLGEYQNDTYNGKGFFIQPDHCYYGDFLDGKQHGEGLIVGDKMYIHADFEKGDILNVKQTTDAFTYEGKEFNKQGERTDKGNGCLGWIGIVIIVALLFGVYSYCSSWLERQKTGNSQQTVLHKTTTTYVCTARTSLTVRSAPNTTAQPIGNLHTGEEVEVYEIVNGFAKIRIGVNDGYASTKYLEKK